MLFWVDECILYAKDSAAIDKVIDSLKDGFLLEKEDDMAGSLGLSILRDEKNGTFTLTQEGLTDRSSQL